jgi:hypothetical protein
MDKYKELIRTNLGVFLSSEQIVYDGIYVIACYPSLGCLYIGYSNDIYKRIRQHLSHVKPLSNFIRANMADACGWRLDLLISPLENSVEWKRIAERKLIKLFNPIFNEYLNHC